MDNTENKQNQSKSDSTVKSPKLSSLVRILAVLLVLAIVFWAGTAIGYRKAEFSYLSSSNYFRAFGMHGGVLGNGMMGVIPDVDSLLGGHGASGKVISVSLPNLIVSDGSGTEKNILITGETVIRSARSTIASTSIKNNDLIVVIGEPNDNGSINDRLIRIMPSTLPLTPSTTNPYGFGGGRGPGMMYYR